MSIVHSVEVTNTHEARHRNVTLIVARFVARLLVCLVLTFLGGGLLVRYALPGIGSLCTTGDPLGFVGSMLLLLWVLSLFDLWRHVYWDVRQFRTFRTTEETLPEESIAETPSEI